MFTNLPQRSHLRRIQARRRRAAVAIITAVFLFGTLIGSWLANHRVTFRSPVVIESREEKLLSPIPEATPSATPKITPRGASLEIVKPVKAAEPEDYITGEASYYSVEGCLGCDPEAIMANGQKLDDTMRTLALTPELVNSRKLLNDMVTVINLATGQKTKARVTDTGGFGKYDRVADLSVATKNAIDCPSLCDVKIVFE